MDKRNILMKIAFILLFGEILVNCKVITHRVQSDNGIISNNNDRENVWRYLKVNLKNTSSLNLSNSSVNSLLNELVISLTNDTQLDERRSFRTIKTYVHKAKRSLKKVFFTFGYYGPELGLCSCLVKYAWYTYPIVPEITYHTMARARRYITDFAHDFMQGFFEKHHQYIEERISNKLAETSADDYFDYQNSINDHTRYPLRRNGDENIPINQQQQQNMQPIQKVDPKLTLLAEMIKNLKPKEKENNKFIIRYSRAYNKSHENGENLLNKKLTHKPNEIYQQNVTHVELNSTKMHAFEGRSIDASILSQNQQQIRRVLVSGTPPGLPTFDELPPADYNYYKDGVHHHVHDLRKNKRPPRGGAWFSTNIEETILSSLGLLPPGKSFPHAQPDYKACAKNYAVAIVLRHIQKLLF